MHPSPSAETSSPLAPNFRFCISKPPCMPVLYTRRDALFRDWSIKGFSRLAFSLTRATLYPLIPSLASQDALRLNGFRKSFERRPSVRKQEVALSFIECASAWQLKKPSGIALLQISRKTGKGK